MEKLQKINWKKCFGGLFILFLVGFFFFFFGGRWGCCVCGFIFLFVVGCMCYIFLERNILSLVLSAVLCSGGGKPLKTVLIATSNNKFSSSILPDGL